MDTLNFTKIFPVKTINTNEVIAILKNYFKDYSRPKRIISDRGGCFTSHEFHNFLVNNNIAHVKIATASPQANGQIERYNRSLTSMLSKLIDENQNIPFEQVLGQIEFSLNNTINRSIGTSPSVLLFGTQQKGSVVDNIREALQSMNDIPVNIKEIRQKAEIINFKAQQYNKKHFDFKRKEPHHYSVGDYVVIKNFTKKHKLQRNFIGPYMIKKVLPNNRYLVSDIEGFQNTQIFYTGVIEAQYLKPWIQNSK